MEKSEIIIKLVDIFTIKKIETNKGVFARFGLYDWCKIENGTYIPISDQSLLEQLEIACDQWVSFCSNVE